MFEWLLNADRWLFNRINQAHDPMVDFVMYWATDRLIWIPFYAWLIYILIKLTGRKTLWIMLITAIMIVISDQVSVLVKDNVQRLRPCHDPYFSDIIHLVKNGCGGRYGFISSHASNTMTLAVLICGILPAGYRYIKFEMAAYVLLVSYSRIYLAAHFPGDIIGGWLLGFVLGCAGVFIYYNLPTVKTNSSVD